MKNFWKTLQPPRFFLSIFVLPGLVMTSQCPPVFTPPPSSQQCPVISLTLDARKCVTVEPPCKGTFVWQSGDTLSITASEEGNLPLDVFNSLDLNSTEIRSGNSLMRRLCQKPDHTGNAPNGRALYQYTFQNFVGEGIYAINFTNQTALTVSIDSDLVSPAVYDYKQLGATAVPVARAEGGMPPYTFRWTVNGVVLPTVPGDPPNVARDIPTKNTEYRVRVFDVGERQAIAAVVVFISNGAGDPRAAFTISPQTIQTGQTVTLNPADSLGNITRWEWDFDWHGEIVEPFDRTINGENGITTTSWNQPGKKYIRLRVTTVAGNFHEIFQQVGVN